jgi:hypothetical protein
VSCSVGKYKLGVCMALFADTGCVFLLLITEHLLVTSYCAWTSYGLGVLVKCVLLCKVC